MHNWLKMEKLATNHGICLLSCLPVREEPNHRSEMVSQLLWGECFEIMEVFGSWARVECAFDHYQGWLSMDSVLGLTKAQFIANTTTVSSYCGSVWGKTYRQGSRHVSIPLGSPLVRWEGIEYECIAHRPQYVHEYAEKVQRLRQFALPFLYAPYLWGGRTPAGVDCSGLVQVVYRMLGTNLPRDSKDQTAVGNIIDFKNTQMGDLAFFANKQGSISHVGIVWEGGKILHASGWVRLDTLDEKGIFNGNNHTHELVMVRRMW